MIKDQIYKLILSNPIYENVLERYLKKKDERNEFRQFLWLYICELDEDKLKTLWDKNQFLFYYCGMVKNQIESKTSSWHKEYRLYKQRNDELTEYIVDDTLNEMEEIELKEEIHNKLKLIDNIIDYHIQRNPFLKVEFDLFRMRYKEKLTYRQIAKKLNIPLTVTYRYIRDAEILIKNTINQKKNKLR